MAAGITQISDKMRAHVYFANVEGNMCPLVGVESVSKIIVRKQGEGDRTIDFKTVSIAEKVLPPCGRLTVCNMEGSSLKTDWVDGDFISTGRETNMYVEVVSDRDLEDVYMVILYKGLKSGGNSAVTMGAIGDLPAGKLVKKNILLRGVAVPGNTRYYIEFYSKGMPVEQHRLTKIASMPNTQGLLIPWDVRMKTFIEDARAKKLTQQPRPFDLFIPPEFKESLKGEGIDQLRLMTTVKKNGTVALKEADEQLSKSDVDRLKSLMQSWHFFPEMKSGRARDKTVAIPLQL
ncbi:MAG: hypothetical protein AB3N63_03785 [Puniceicoccaceae bacterium]